jgi:3-phosphoglycerate kinase
LFFAEPEIRIIITGLVCQAFKHCNNFEVGRSVLEQIAYFIGKHNMYPTAKIFATAAKVHKNYEKAMKEMGLADIVVTVMKLKEPKGQKALEGALKK